MVHVSHSQVLLLHGQALASVPTLLMQSYHLILAFVLIIVSVYLTLLQILVLVRVQPLVAGERVRRRVFLHQ